MEPLIETVGKWIAFHLGQLLSCAKKERGKLALRSADGSSICITIARNGLQSFDALCRIPGKYQGQWQEGKRHGYGIRTSAPFGLASHHRRKNLHASLSSLRSGENGNAAKMVEKAEEIRGGFVLTAKSDKLPVRRNSLTDKTGKKGFLMVCFEAPMVTLLS